MLIIALNEKKLAFLIANKTSETICSTSNLIKKPEQEKGAEKKASKHQLAWDWKKSVPVPEKKLKIGPIKAVKSRKKYVCIECLKLSFLGKSDEKFASLCRRDTSKKRDRPSALLYHQMHQKSSRFENNTTAPRLQQSRASQKKKRPIL